MTPDIKRVQLLNGLNLPYVEQGDPSGVPVVLLHAFADSWRSFEVVLRHLPQSIHAFAVTQRGHGDADRPVSGYGVGDFTADVASFVDAVGLRAVVIVASSSAGFTARRFAAEHPQRTLGVVLIGSPYSLHGKPTVAVNGACRKKRPSDVEPGLRIAGAADPRADEMASGGPYERPAASRAPVLASVTAGHALYARRACALRACA